MGKELLVSIRWLKDHLNDSNLVLIDASQSFKEPSDSSLVEKHIPTSKTFNLKENFSDKSSIYPNMLPSAIQFQEEVQNIGVNTNSVVVVYDNQGVYFSPRVWWMFTVMGHNNVFVLDGGLTEWKKQKGDLVHSSQIKSTKGNFKATINQNLVRNFDVIKNNIKTQNECVIDARSEGRFKGLAPEPRKELVSGCILGSSNIPYTKVLDNGMFKSKKELNAVFKELEYANKPFVFTCGSGVTACIVLVASIIAGYKIGAVYDGSWTEWVMRS